MLASNSSALVGIPRLGIPSNPGGMSGQKGQSGQRGIKHENLARDVLNYALGHVWWSPNRPAAGSALHLCVMVP